MKISSPTLWLLLFFDTLTTTSSLSQSVKRAYKYKNQNDNKGKKGKVSSNPTNNKKSILSGNNKPLHLKTQLKYAQDGHCVIRNCLDKTFLKKMKAEILGFISREDVILESYRQKVHVACGPGRDCNSVEECCQVLEKLNIPALPFLQHFNLWRELPLVKQLTQDETLIQYAVDLLGLSSKDGASLRLYQDSLFHKRVGDGETPWHSDARMAPFDTSSMITFWIPLTNLVKSTGLVFVSKSHADFALPYWNSSSNKTGGEYSRLEERYKIAGVEDYMPVKIGDMTAHAGWTLHCADANLEDVDRYAIAVTYVDGSAEVREDIEGAGKNVMKSKKKQKKTRQSYNKVLGDDEDYKSFSDWIGDVMPRNKFQHHLVPIVWRQASLE